jgi:hypothetical protein
MRLCPPKLNKEAEKSDDLGKGILINCIVEVSKEK